MWGDPVRARSIRAIRTVMILVLFIIGAAMLFIPWDGIATEGVRTIDMTSSLIIQVLSAFGWLTLFLGILLLYSKSEETKVALGAIGAFLGLLLMATSALTFNSYAFDELHIVQRTQSLLLVLGAITLLASFAVAAMSWRKGIFATG